jgi:hypothetical protein
MKSEIERLWAFDTDLIIHALDRDSEHYGTMTKLMSKSYTEEIGFAVTFQNILEAQNILLEYYDIPAHETLNHITNFINGFRFVFIYPMFTTYKLYAHLIDRYKKDQNIDHYDLFLTATLVDNDIHQLLTLKPENYTDILEVFVASPLEILKDDFPAKITQ